MQVSVAVDKWPPFSLSLRNSRGRCFQGLMCGGGNPKCPEHLLGACPRWPGCDELCMPILQMRKLRLEELNGALWQSSAGFLSHSPGPGPHGTAGPVGKGKKQINLKQSGDERVAQERKQVEDGCAGGWVVQEDLPEEALGPEARWGMPSLGLCLLSAPSVEPWSTGACSHLRAFAPAVLIPPPECCLPRSS